MFVCMYISQMLVFNELGYTFLQGHFNLCIHISASLLDMYFLLSYEELCSTSV